MATEVDVCSAAVVELGGQPLADLTSTEMGRTAGTLFPLERDRLMRRHPWSFLRARKVLSNPSENVGFDLTNVFALPVDFQRLEAVGYGLNQDQYQLVYDPNLDRPGIATGPDVTTLPVVYFRSTPSPANWPGWFVDLMQCAMKARLAYAVTNSRTVAADAKQEFEALYRVMTGAHGAETASRELQFDDDLMAARG